VLFVAFYHRQVVPAAEWLLYVLPAGMLKTLPEGVMAMTSLVTASGWRCPEEQKTEAHPQPLLPSEAEALAFVYSSRVFLSVLPGRI